MSKLRSALFLLLGVLIIVLIVHFVGAKDVIDAMLQADPVIFGGAILCQAAAIFCWAARWKLLFRSVHPVHFKNVLSGVIIGIFFNNITPIAKAGGEPFRAYFLKEKEGMSFEDAFATVAIDRVLESFPFMMILIISLAFFVLRLEVGFTMILILCVALVINVVLLSLVMYVSFSLNAAKWLMFSFLRIVARFSNRLDKYESKMEDAVERYHGAVRAVSSQKGIVIASLCISTVFWMLTIFRNYFVVLALGYQADFIVIVVIQIVATLTGVLPILPGGLGSTDGAMIFLFYSFDFSAPAAVTISLLDRFIAFWLMNMVGATFVVMERDFLKGGNG
jgi:uncharacterized protein (TIRG00374 family)